MGSVRNRHARLMVAVVVVLGAVGAGAPAKGAPFAGKFQQGLASFVVGGTDGVRYFVNLVVEETAGASASAAMTVEIKACRETKCTAGATYGKVLDPSEFEIGSNSNSAQLRTEFAGYEVSVSWSSSGATTGVGSEIAPASHVRTGTENGANVSGSLFGFSCNTAGEIRDMVEVAVDRAEPSPPPEPNRVPRGLLRGKKGAPTCGA